MEEPPFDDGAVHERLIWDDDAAEAVRPVGDPGAVVVVPPVADVTPDAFTSIATSSHKSPLPLAVQPHVTAPADVVLRELDAPVTALGILVSQP